jgi:hypothetical protein
MIGANDRDPRMSDEIVTLLEKSEFAAAAKLFYDDCRCSDGCWKGGDFVSCIRCLIEALRAEFAKDNRAAITSLFSEIDGWQLKAISERDRVYNSGRVEAQ